MIYLPWSSEASVENILSEIRNTNESLIKLTSLIPKIIDDHMNNVNDVCATLAESFSHVTIENMDLIVTSLQDQNARHERGMNKLSESVKNQLAQLDSGPKVERTPADHKVLIKLKVFPRQAIVDAGE